jgi:hypothetical protein
MLILDSRCHYVYGLKFVRNFTWLAPVLHQIPGPNRKKRTRQAMYSYVLRNNEVRSCNHCCGGKSIHITYCIFKVCKFVHHYTIQINQPTRCNSFSILLLVVYVQLKMFRASSRPSSGAQQLQ